MVRALESGSVLMEMRGGKYEVLGGFFEVVTVKGVLDGMWEEALGWQGGVRGKLS